MQTNRTIYEDGVSLVGDPYFTRLFQERTGPYTDFAACLTWTGRCNQKGYGIIFVKSVGYTISRQLRAHRLSWELHNGPIPKGMEVAHDCMAFGAPEDNKLCVNPAHLKLLSSEDHREETKAKRQSVWRPNRVVGIRGRGENIAWAVLSEEKVREIRRLKEMEGVSFAELSRLYGVAPETIRQVVIRDTWKHVV